MKNYSQKIIKTTTFAFSIFTFLFSVEAQSIDPLNKYTNADPVTLASNTNTFDKERYLNLYTDYSYTNEPSSPKSDNAATTLLKEVGSVIHGAIGSTDSDNASELGSKITEGITSHLKNQAISKTETLINDSANQLINQFSPGRSEISINGIQSERLHYEIKTIQPLSELNKDSSQLTFLQAQFATGENHGSPRNTLNLGVGQRHLLEGGRSIVGFNLFTDYETRSKHKRASIGLEYRRTNFSTHINRYYPLSDRKNIGKHSEESQEGHDIKLIGQVPYLPWAKIKSTHYLWKGVQKADVKGSVFGVEIELSPSSRFEFGTENNNDSDRSSYLRLSTTLPLGENDKQTRFFIADQAFQTGGLMDLDGLNFVERSNKIRVEKVLRGIKITMGKHSAKTENATCELTGSAGKSYLGTTSEDGTVELPVATDFPIGLVTVSCVGGEYINEAEGDPITNAPTLRAAMNYTGGDLTIFTSPLSEVAYQRAGGGASSTTLTDTMLASLKDNIAKENKDIATAFGIEEINILNTLPSDLNDSKVDETNSVMDKFAWVLAGISTMYANETSPAAALAQLTTDYTTMSKERMSSKFATAMNNCMQGHHSNNVSPTNYACNGLRALTMQIDATVSIDEGKEFKGKAPISNKTIGELTYTLGGDDASKLSIDKDTGVVTMVSRDFETAVDANNDNHYKITIIATSNKGVSASATQTIQVTNVFEGAAISISANAFSVNETVADDTLVGKPNYAGTISSYTITSGNTGNAFKINDAGEILVKDTSKIVYVAGALNQYTLIIEITGDDVANEETSITIDIIENRNAPTPFPSLDIQDQTRDIQENTDINTDVGAPLEASGNPTKFEITAGNADGLFKINATTGQIQVAKAELDYETTPVYTLTVEIEKTGVATKSARISINITNVSETVRFKDSASNADEANKIQKLVVELDAPSKQAVTVTYTVTSANTANTATNIEDYTIADNKTLTIAAGDTQNTIDIDIKDDSKDEYPETITITLATPSSYALGTATHTHTINDNDDQPSVSFANRSSATFEADSPENLSVKLNTASGKKVVVNYTVSGTATDADYTLADGTLTFDPGATTPKDDISLQIKTDNIDEGDETVIVTLANDNNLKNATLGINKAHTHTITDDDTRGFAQSPPDTLNVPESSSKKYAFKLKTQPTGTVTITPYINNPAATISPAKITFTKDQDDWRKEHTFTVTGKEDDNATNETFKISHIVTGADYNHYSNRSANGSIGLDDISLGDLTGFDGIDITLMTNIVTITMEDNDDRGITQSSTKSDVIKVPESGEALEYTFKLNTQPTGDVTITPVRYSSTSTDAATISKAIIFTAINWRDKQTITVTGKEDDNATNEKFTIHHEITGTDEHYKNISTHDMKIEMIDDDNRGITQSYAKPDVVKIPESGGVLKYTVKLNTEPTGDVTITPVSINPTDAATISKAIIFTTANWRNEQTITVTGKEDDNTINEGFTLHHEVTGADYESNSVSAIDIKIEMLDNDRPGVSLSPTTILTVPETGQVIYTLKLNTQPTANVTITPESSNTDAATVSSAIIFTTSNWRDEQPITVTGVTDANVEKEQLNISHTVVGGDYAGNSVPNIAITTTDNTLIIKDQVFNIDENSVIGSAFDALTTQGNPTAFTITAGNTDDAFKIDNSGIITVDKNVLDYETLTGKKYTLAVQISKTDSTLETATVTININDISELVSFDTATSESEEATATQDVVVKLNTINSQVVTVDYTIANGTATAPEDYSATSTGTLTGTLTFAQGETTKTIHFNTKHDLIDEDDETVIITLSNPIHTALDSVKTIHTHTIRDNDISRISFDKPSSNNFESVSTTNLGITLSTPSAKNINISYTVTGTATAPDDYTATNGTLTINAGKTSGNITLTIKNDNLNEPDETIIITLSNASNGVLDSTKKVHTYTIKADDSSATKTTLEITNSAALADGTPSDGITGGTEVNNKITFTLQPRDSHGRPTTLPLDKAVTLLPSDTTTAIPMTPTTDGSGSYTAFLNSATAKTITAQAKIAGIDSGNAVNVHFVESIEGNGLNYWSLDIFEDRRLKPTPFDVNRISPPAQFFFLGDNITGKPTLYKIASGNTNDIFQIKPLTVRSQVSTENDALWLKNYLNYSTDSYELKISMHKDYAQSKMRKLGIKVNPGILQKSTLTASSADVLSNDNDSSTITLNLMANGKNIFNPVRSAIAMSVTGSAKISALTNQGQGVYTATVTNTVGEEVTISASIAGKEIDAKATVQFSPFTMGFSTSSSSGDDKATTQPVLKVELSETRSQDTTVDYTVTGTATHTQLSKNGLAYGSNIDYILANGTLAIPANSLSADIPLKIENNRQATGNKTVIVTLSNPSSEVALIASKNEHTYIIQDTDMRGVTFVEKTNNITANNKEISLAVRLNSEPIFGENSQIRIGENSQGSERVQRFIISSGNKDAGIIDVSESRIDNYADADGDNILAYFSKGNWNKPIDGHKGDIDTPSSNAPRSFSVTGVPAGYNGGEYGIRLKKDSVSPGEDYNNSNYYTKTLTNTRVAPGIRFQNTTNIVTVESPNPTPHDIQVSLKTDPGAEVRVYFGTSHYVPPNTPDDKINKVNFLAKNRNNEAITGRRSALIFNSTNWADPQTVSIVAQNNDLGDTVGHRTRYKITAFTYANSGYYRSLTKTVTENAFFVNDDTPPPGFKTIVSGDKKNGVYATRRDGRKVQIQLKLTSKPIFSDPSVDQVYVDIHSLDYGEGAFINSAGVVSDRTTLYFTKTNWNEYQTVSVVGQPSQPGYGEIEYSVRITPNGGNYDYFPFKDIKLINLKAPLIFNTKSIATVIESGNNPKPSEFTIRLGVKRIGPTYIRVEVESHKDLVRLTRPDPFGRPYSLYTIEEGDWDKPLPISVVAINNDTIEADVNVKINVSFDSNPSQLLGTVTVTRKNDDFWFNTKKYGTTTSPTTGRVWLDRNLDASQVATARNDSAAYGGYYQWGRAGDGHQLQNSRTVGAGAAYWYDQYSFFFLGGASSRINDWIWNPNKDREGVNRSDFWTKGRVVAPNGKAHIICPIDYRVATMAELSKEKLHSAVAAYNSFLKLPSSGYRSSGSSDAGNYIAVRSETNLWTSNRASATISSDDIGFTNGWAYRAGNGYAGTDWKAWRRYLGLAVRCIKKP